MKRILSILVATLTMTVILSGCTQQEETIQTGLVHILIGDTPLETFSRVTITFTEVRLYSNETGWINITSEPKTVDLIYLHMNNLNESLGLQKVQLANYTKLWITVENATGVLATTNGTVVFDVPSNALKIQHLFTVQEGNTTILVDIDLNNSIIQMGHGGYKLLPVLGRVHVQQGNGTQTEITKRTQLKEMMENRKPSLEVTVNGENIKSVDADVNETITFNASETYDVDNDPLTFTWDFGDGTNETGPVVVHSYADAGKYTVEVTVSDGIETDTDRLHVDVGSSQGNE